MAMAKARPGPVPAPLHQLGCPELLEVGKAPRHQSFPTNRKAPGRDGVTARWGRGPGAGPGWVLHSFGPEDARVPGGSRCRHWRFRGCPQKGFAQGEGGSRLQCVTLVVQSVGQGDTALPGHDPLLGPSRPPLGPLLDPMGAQMLQLGVGVRVCTPRCTLAPVPGR